MSITDQCTKVFHRQICETVSQPNGQMCIKAECTKVYHRRMWKHEMLHANYSFPTQGRIGWWMVEPPCTVAPPFPQMPSPLQCIVNGGKLNFTQNSLSQVHLRHPCGECNPAVKLTDQLRYETWFKIRYGIWREIFIANGGKLDFTQAVKGTAQFWYETLFEIWFGISHVIISAWNYNMMNKSNQNVMYLRFLM